MWPFAILAAIAMIILFVWEGVSKKKKFQSAPPQSEPDRQPAKRDTRAYVHIPIEILPNGYELELSDVTLEHRIRDEGNLQFDYVTLNCRICYQLNGTKPGKRTLVFTSYDATGHIIETCGDHVSYYFTEAGQDVVKVCFNDCRKAIPSKITVLVRECK